MPSQQFSLYVWSWRMKSSLICNMWSSHLTAPSNLHTQRIQLWDVCNLIFLLNLTKSLTWKCLYWLHKPQKLNFDLWRTTKVLLECHLQAQDENRPSRFVLPLSLAPDGTTKSLCSAWKLLAWSEPHEPITVNSNWFSNASDQVAIDLPDHVFKW